MVSVTDARTAEPIRGGSLSILWGDISLTAYVGLPAAVRTGEYDVFVSVPGYPPEMRHVDLRGYAGQMYPLEIQLQEGRSITGIVVDGEGLPVKGIAVAVMLKQHWFSSTLVYSGNDGRFKIDFVPRVGGKLCALSAQRRNLAEVDISGDEVILIVPSGSDGQ
jgi:hypothetical protein